MDSLSYQNLNMPAACMATYDKTGLISDIGKTGSDTKNDDFQKLLDKKAQEKDPLVEEPAKAPAKSQASAKKEKAPAQEKEDALTRAKKMLEQNGNVVAFKPDWPCIYIDANTGETIAAYNPGEYIKLFNGETFENIPITDLEPWQQAQLNQLLIDPQPIDVSDPKVDAILAATAPGADNSPAAMLEQVVAEQFGKAAQQTAEEAQPQEQEGSKVEVIEVDQAPQQIFHDVKAAPVKVGEAYSAEQPDEADVVRQVENQIVQAVQNGESTVTVKLTPENLGEVTVQVSMKSGGILAVAISARNDDTRALLERHSVNLQELLSTRVRQTVEVDIQRGQENQQSQNHPNYDGHNGHAQDQQQERRQQREHTSTQDFMQQLRLGLIPGDGEF